MEKTTILIVGLGQIGSSIGLALEAHSDRYLRIGYSTQKGNIAQAKKNGVIDKAAADLPSGVREADIVVLALPLDQVEAALKLMAGELKEGALVLDTSPARNESAIWASNLISKGCDYLGFVPVLNPQELHSSEAGMIGAKESLFQNGMIAITVQMKTRSEALQQASELAQQMQAMPFFADIEEVDSYLAVMHVLPQLLAAGITNITVESSGWGEIRKMAGRPYAQLTNLIENIDLPESLALAAKVNQENVLRVLDDMILELRGMREDLANSADGAFDARIQRAGEGRRRWWEERQTAEWLLKQGADSDISAGGSFIG